MQRGSPPEFKRRVLAAAISYLAQLKSIDYAKRRYVDADTYNDDPVLLGDATSDYLRDGVKALMIELYALHTAGDLTFGVFGAEITLYRVPHAIDTARMLSNRGLLLEVLPILRLCLEMIAWSSVAFYMENDEAVKSLKAHDCIAELKRIYGTSGKLYGYLSKFAHWGHVVHRQFISVTAKQTSVLYASARYRAMALALCVIVVDVLVEVVRKLYGERSKSLIMALQGVLERNSSRKSFVVVADIVEMTQLDELREIQRLLC